MKGNARIPDGLTGEVMAHTRVRSLFETVLTIALMTGLIVGMCSPVFGQLPSWLPPHTDASGKPLDPIVYPQPSAYFTGVTTLSFSRVLIPGLLALSAGAQGTGSLSAKPFTAWTAEEIKLVRTLSPWSRPSAIVQTRDVPSTRRPPSEKIAFNIPVTLRWESALTMRRAAARAQAMRENLSAADTEALLEAEPPHYVLEVARRDDALNFPVFYTVTDGERQAWTRCTLQTSKRKLLPTEVSIKGEKGEVVRVLFPRTVEGQPAITANDEAVTLVCKDPWVTINVKFDLKIMALDGKPDL